RSEEQALGIALGPKGFWISIHEPQVGDWPSIIPDGRPLIDPESMKMSDLPDSIAGAAARTIWQSREVELGKIKKELQTERKANGFDGVLRRALGDPNAVNIVTNLKQGLLDINPTVVAKAVSTITKELCIPVDAFNRLMVIKARDDNAKLTK